MKKAMMLAVLALVGSMLLATNAQAYLYLPDVKFNHVGTANYDGNGNLSITALTDGLTFDGVNTYVFNPNLSVSGTSFSAQLLKQSGSRWSFGTDSSSLPDIVIKGTPFVFPGQPSLPSDFASTGVLITGSITSLIFDAAINRITGTFSILGGDLYPYYEGVGYRGMYEMNMERVSFLSDPSTLSGTRWSATGLKGDISPVPEPATMLLLGTGLLGVFAVARRKTVKK